MSKAKALSKQQINHVLSVCNLMTHKEDKRCALVLSHAAMRVTEIALTDTRTILYPSGKIREEIHLPAAVCKNLKSRTVWLTNTKSREVLQEWVDYRIKRKWGTVINSDLYQGLNPKSKFLFNNRAKPYAITAKLRKLKGGNMKTYWASDALEHMMRQVYKKAGLHHASSHSGRKSLVSNAIINQGRTLEQMAHILGHSDSETTLLYVDISTKRLSEMYDAAL